MAKKSSETSGKCSVFDLVSKVDCSVEILSDARTAVIADYIDSGNYMLNAAMTGSIFKGAPTGRVLTLTGEPGTGKTFIALSLCRNAQKKGYTPIYIDSEGAIDEEFVKRMGCDTHNFVIKQASTVGEVSTFIANITKDLLAMKAEDRPKIIMVLDSVGNLASDKEVEDALAGNGKAEMRRAKDIKAMFRVNMTNISKLQIPFVVCTHQYYSQDFISKTIVGGGSGVTYNSSLTIMLTTSKLDDKAAEEAAKKHQGDFKKTGVLVSAKAAKSRFTIPQVIRFQIPFFKEPNPYIGLDLYIDWETCGIVRGKALTEKEYNKLSDGEKSTCYEFSGLNGEKLYALPKDTSRNIVVKHLGGEVPLIELFSSKVLTDEILHEIDEKKIKPNFELPTHTSDEDITEFLEIDQTCQ
jgi:RecA/RadA recombinase